MMPEFDLETKICLAVCEDYEARSIAKAALDGEYGAGAYEVIRDAVTEKDENKYLALKEKIDALSGIGEAESRIISEKIAELRRKAVFRIPIKGIMDMFNSGDDFAVKKAKDLIVITYGKYVFSLIHKNYPTYADKYGDELYNCGCIGLMNAMKGYDVSKGSFTTYCKFFVIHEISQQVNFHRNDSSTYFNGVQRRVKEAQDEIRADGQEPTVTRIAIKTGLKPDIVKRELDYMETTRFRYLDAEDEKEQACEYEDTPEHIVSKRNGMEQLFASIDRLGRADAKMRDVVLLKYDGSRTNEEIAKTLGLTIGQVKTLYTRGLRTLRKDEGLRSFYGEYLSDAECEMQKYSVPKMEPAKKTEDRMDALDNVIGLMATFGEGVSSESVKMC